MSGEFEYSARLREIAAVGGQAWLNQKCAKSVAQHIQLDGSQVEGITDSLKTHGIVCKPQDADYSSDTSTSGSSSSSSSPSPASVAQHSRSFSSSSDKPLEHSIPAEEITNVRPLNQKPCFRFEPSSLANKLPDFLASMKAANDVLATGDSEEHKIELSESDSDRPHIEMNLGLGVLEEIKNENESLSPPITIKGKGPVTKGTTPANSKLNTTEDDSISSGMDSNATSESSNSPPSSLKLNLIHHKRDIKPRAGKKGPSNNLTKGKMTHKASAPTSFPSSISKDGPNKPIIFKLLFKPTPSEQTTVQLEVNHDWSSVVDHDEGQETEPLPANVKLEPKDLEAFSENIVSAAGLDQLPGYNVVVASV